MYDILIEKIRYNYFILFFLSILIIVFSTLLSLKSGSYGGILIIAISLVPFVQIYNKLIEKDERISEKIKSKKNMFLRYKEYFIMSFVIFFASIIGFYIGYLIDYNLFYPQIQAIEDIREHVIALSYGHAIYPNSFFTYILFNNMTVLLLFFSFSIIFGAGSIYLLLWNASIIGVFLGLRASEYISNNIIYKFILIPTISLLEILPHGILEFLGYFLAALAGNILSIAFIKNLDKETLETILSDSLALFVLSILFIFIAALIEAYII
ncbi:MAG: stage II sporulation protein M [Candidatus Nanopusillus sp.]|nr:stage II sporulation protein M [Candidatus Nanopusillus sp.]MCG2882722.1 stage II sporulation protein M [Candidatus Nanopusillus sp.]